MTFQRTGKREVFFWVVFLLENLGRFTWKSLFFLVSLFVPILKNIILLFFKIYRIIIPIIRSILNSFGKFSQLIKTLKAEIKFRVWLSKRKKRSLKINLPQLKFPQFSFPKFAWTSFSLLIIFLFSFYFLLLKDLPSPTGLTNHSQPVSTKIYDRNGKLLYTIYNGNQNRSLVRLEQVPQSLKEATIAVEDKDFYRHQGFSIRGIMRALERNIFNHTVEGGSTITQQLVKNTLLSPEKTLLRKSKELILALEVELLYTKDEILQLYFNQIPYGGTAYGIQAAAKTYFNCDVKDLTLAQAALLAGLPAAPTQFSPFGANPAMAFVRQKEVLELMVKDGIITEEEKNKALAEKLVFAAQKTDIEAPHFVMYVKDLLVKKYGQRMVEEGGLEVTTSLDLDIQEMAQNQIKQELDKLSAFNVGNGSVLVTNPKSGDILAMVGSRDYFDQTHDGNVNVTTSLRQPGSSIKVINYAVALQSGFNPSSVISDTPVVYKNPWEIYAPVNYDGRYHGNVTLRTALASSYNIPAVKILASYGVDKMVAMGKMMGITTWEDPSRFGLSLTLGGGEVKMTDMSVVYGTLANQGKRVSLRPILKVVDYQGKILENGNCEKFFNNTVAAADNEALCQPQQVLSANVAYLLADILSDNAARTPAFGPNSQLVIPGYQVAVKTGTTNDKRDNWTIGFTQDFVVTTWVGNNDNSPMSAVASGVTGASPIWHNIMQNLLAGRPAVAFEKPQELKAVEICSLNGLLPCEGCPTKVEYFMPGTEPKVHCDSAAMKKAREEEEKKNQPSNQPSPQGQILNGVSTEQ